ncbi:MAG TPA: phosphoenolpyruvate--protein phosphotransferase [Sphingomicrobium sp.]|nr:phosphoenolpyruvate--protein phosphotransferase [Sphingomicrobium sp.]
MSSDDVQLVAPLTGWLTPLEEVPDPVFAERMMGAGVAIDPTSSKLCAPADATVITIPETAHAVTLRLDNGAELLIHVGLETVALSGSGFHALSAAGARVKAGDPLIELDLNSIARLAKSLVTPIILASDGYSLELNPISRRVSIGEPIGRVGGRQLAGANQGSGTTHELVVTMSAAHGLHARPAARIATLLKPFAAEVSILGRERSANARSVVAMLGLGLRKGDEARIVGEGHEAKSAVEAVAGLIQEGLGETESDATAAVPSQKGAPICASPGIAIGHVVQFKTTDLQVPFDGAGVGHEREILALALRAVADATVGQSGVAAELAAAHRTLLEDPDLLAHANREIAAGRSAAFAWRSACRDAQVIIKSTGDALLIERGADLADIERRVIGALISESSPEFPDLSPGSILVAPDLLPSQFQALDRTQLAAICTAEGGPTAHVAILAASAGIPMIVNAGQGILDVPEGTTVIVDADHCQIEIDPKPRRLSEARQLIDEKSATRASETRDAQALAFTADNVRIEVFANLGSIEDARAAVAAGAEGCGLLRTEFLFLDRDEAPSSDEQQQVYSAIAGALGGRPIVVRTLDIGADKSVPYVAVGREDNPALGLRGIRLSLARPDLLETQLRAIAAAVPKEQCRIMLPMITDVAEVRRARQLLQKVQQSLGLGGRLLLGVMIETPAAAILAEQIAAEADFLSVGSNDLTQYALAADRGNSAVAAMVDALHPAVLRLIRQAAEGAQAGGRWIGVCGALASDPMATAILIGLGVTELSVTPAAVPAIKAAVRRLATRDCQLLAKSACAAALPEEVRAMVAGALK